MSDSKQKKSSISNVRLPAELVADLRKIAARAELAEEKRPVFGDILLQAWRLYKKSGALDFGAAESVPPTPLERATAEISKRVTGGSPRSAGTGETTGVPEAVQSSIRTGETTCPACGANVALPTKDLVRVVMDEKAQSPVLSVLDLRESDILWVERLLQILHGDPTVATGIQINLIGVGALSDIATIPKGRSTADSGGTETADPKATDDDGGNPERSPDPGDVSKQRNAAIRESRQRADNVVEMLREYLRKLNEPPEGKTG